VSNSIQHTLSATALKAAAVVSEARLWHSIEAMAEIGGLGNGGVTRQALTREDIAARALLIRWAQALGLEVSIDDAANLFLRRPGQDPGAAPVLAGSHMDSQPAGGRFDGIYGVLAAFEAMQALHDADIVTYRPIDVVAWTNEEGGRFERGCTGSSVWAGQVPLSAFLEDIGSDGVRFADALAETLAATPDLPRRPPHWPAYAYVEPHIEQGPVLEKQGLDIAAVTGIQGVRWMRVEIAGVAGHAGTTPAALRRDALQAAVRAITWLNGLMEDPRDLTRFTVGRLVVEPNSPNTVPSKVTFTIDFRHPDAAELKRRGSAIERVVHEAVKPCAATVVTTSEMSPTPFDGPIPSLIERAAVALGLKAARLSSGAFHDALYAATVCPAGMLFIPCRNGVSHSPEEYSTPAQCVAGARVLAATVVELANQA
jgi:N-carbamoyl-L-amino-acid hydrolase